MSLSSLLLLAALLLGTTRAAALQADDGSVLVVMPDDLGVDALPFYGLDPLVRPDLTPNLAALAALGVRFDNAWGAPKCSPARAALQTGRAAFRTGIGNVIEAGGHSLATSELTIPELLLQRASVPYATAYFGKWHLERSGTTQACAPGLHGYQHFAGTLFQVPQSPGYCDWRERVCNGTSGSSPRSFEYMPGVIFDQAADWMSARSGRWFALLAPQLPYDILHTPPSDLQTLRDDPACTSCASGTRACFDAAIQALDSKLGQLLQALGPDWPERITLFFVGDNGTPNFVNRYWPANRAKLTLYEGGVRVPFLVAGRAVPPARRGNVSTALVSVSDVYRTVASLAGVAMLPAGTAQDSYDLTPLLADPPRPNGRTHLLAESFGRNAPAPPYVSHKVALRDARHKVLYNWTERRALALYDLAVDPREQRNLLQPAPPAPSTPAGAALQGLVQRIHELLGS
jgi:arylsulfatase A-like enzyme